MAAWRAAVVYFLGAGVFVEQQVLSVRTVADLEDDANLVNKANSEEAMASLAVKCAIASNVLSYPDTEVDMTEQTRQEQYGDPTILAANGLSMPDKDGEKSFVPVEVRDRAEAEEYGYQWYRADGEEVVGNTPINGVARGRTAADVQRELPLGAEALFLMNERAHARTTMQKAGWTLRQRYVKPTVDGDPEVYIGVEVAGVRFDIWLRQEGSKPRQMMITCRGSYSSSDVVDIWKWLGDLLKAPEFAESYATLFQKYVDADVVPVATAQIKTWFGTAAAAAWQGTAPGKHNASLMGDRTDAAMKRRVQANGYFELLPSLADWIIYLMGEHDVSIKDCIVTGHSGGGARAHVLAELLYHKAGKLAPPSVITFNVPGYYDRYLEVLQYNGVQPSLIAEEYSHPVDFWSTAVQSYPSSQSMRKLHLFELKDAHKAKLRALCRDLVGTSGTGLFVLKARAYKSCRHITHTGFALYKNLVMAPLRFYRSDQVAQSEEELATLIHRAADQQEIEATLPNVGVKVDAQLGCPHCRQRFDDQRELDLHQKFIHGAGLEQGDLPAVAAQQVASSSTGSTLQGTATGAAVSPRTPAAKKK